MLRLFTLSRASKNARRTAVSPQPKLPPELERIIFSYAYANEAKDIQNLILVARRVEEWLCAPIFKVTVLLQNHRSPLKLLRLSTFLRYGKYINYLALNLSILKSIQDSEETSVKYLFNLRRTVVPRLLVNVLAACPNLVNLWLFTNELIYAKNLFPVFSPMITHLTIQLPLLLGQLSSNLKKSKSNSPSPSPLYPGITHIHVLRYLFKQGKEDCQALVLSIHFPNLTHLAVPTRNVVQKQEEGLKLALDRCTKLEVVVLMRLIGDLEWRLSLPVEDIRVPIVHLELPTEPIEPWKAGARGDGHDIWEIADEKRKTTMRREGRKV